MKRILFAAAVAAFCGVAWSNGASPATPGLPTQHAPAGARVYLISPQEGAMVSSPVTVRFGLEGMGVAPAGMAKEHTGHHHLLVDVTSLPPAGQPIPKDAHHVHFGGGQTEATLKLAPGTHTLQLELGDENHLPFAPPLVSKKLTIQVR